MTPPRRRNASWLPEEPFNHPESYFPLSYRRTHARPDVIILKGLGNTIKQAYCDIPRGYIEVESQGINHPDLRKIGEYRNVRRPCFPLDDDVEFVTR